MGMGGGNTPLRDGISRHGAKNRNPMGCLFTAWALARFRLAAPQNQDSPRDREGVEVVGSCLDLLL